MGRSQLRRSPRQRLRRNIRQNQELIHPALATRMILPALFPAHIRRMKSMTARRLTTAGWCSTCMRSKYLYTPDIDSARLKAESGDGSATSGRLRSLMPRIKLANYAKTHSDDCIDRWGQLLHSEFV